MPGALVVVCCMYVLFERIICSRPQTRPSKEGKGSGEFGQNPWVGSGHKTKGTVAL